MSCPTTRRARPTLKRPTPGTSPRPGAGSPPLQLGLPVVWTAAAARGLRPRRRGALDGRARRPSWSGCAARGASRRARTPTWWRSTRRPTFTVDAHALHHRHPVTPYAGRTLRGVVRRTWLRGRVVDGTDARAAAVPGAEAVIADVHSRLPDLASRAAGRRRGRLQRRVLRRRPTAWSRRSRRRSRRRRSGPRARSTTDGRPAGAASPATTGRSSGSARPASSAGSSWTPPGSPATIPPYASVDGVRGGRLPVAGRAGRARDWVAAACAGRRWPVTRRTRSRSRRRRRVTHVRLNIFPDGGVARLRVHGEVVPDPRMLGPAGRSTWPRWRTVGWSSAAATCSTAARTTC